MCWLEIPITSHSRAMKFYNTVFGWECETDGVPSPIAEIKEVFMFKRGPFTQGAFVVMDEANISRVVSDENTDKRKLGVLVTLYVDDGINSALERIEKAGGKTCV